MTIEKICRICGAELTVDNWYPSLRRCQNNICKNCQRIQNNDWAKNNPEKAKANWTRRDRKLGHRPMSENKECSSYIGVHVNEGLIKLYFDDVEVMPYGNPGYDFICKNGWKIDGKSSCLHKDGRWSFVIRHNTTADYFFCVAYDNREDLNIIHIWILPGEKFNHLSGISISKRNIRKWVEYEQPLDKAIVCCDSMKGGNK